MSDAPVIEMSDVAVINPRAPGLTLIDRVDWRVEPGDCWVIAGLQGSGKTAVLETIAGLHPFARGDIRVFGQPLAAGGGDAVAGLRRRLGLVFDGHGRLFPSLSVFENVALPLCYHFNLSLPKAAPQINELLAALDLTRLSDVSPGRLSRGWAHRVALARALALKPEVLLLDNPFTGLDPIHLRWWRTFLAALRSGRSPLGDRPSTVVIASDELRPVLGIGHRFAVTHEGTWRVIGDRQAVERGDDPLVRELLAESD